MTIPLVCCNSDNIDAVKKILQDQRNHRKTPAVGMLPITSKWQTHSVYRTHHITGHAGCSTFRSDCSGLQGF